jgi:hypothetical protein
VSKVPQQEKGSERKHDGLVLVVQFELIMSLDEFEKFKRRGGITKASWMKNGKEDL